jgi:hypothetical protein
MTAKDGATIGQGSTIKAAEDEVKIVVPDDWEEGEKIDIEIGGQKLKLKLPPGTQAGQTLTVQTRKPGTAAPAPAAPTAPVFNNDYFENIKGWTDEERDDYIGNLEQSPLFMDEEDVAKAMKLPEGENSQVDALRELIALGDPYLVAKEAKEKGNDLYKDGKKSWNHAVLEYTHGIHNARMAVDFAVSQAAAVKEAEARANGTWSPPSAAEVAEAERREERRQAVEAAKKALGRQEEFGPTKTSHTVEQCRSMLCQLLCNRAMINLKKRNFREVRKDCLEALRLEPTNIKAWYRAAKAMFSLKKYKECGKFAMGGLRADRRNQPLRRLLRDAARLEAERAEAERAAAFQREAEAVEAELLEAAIGRSGARIVPYLFESMGKYGVAPSLEGEGETARLQWPLLLLYDEHSQSDILQSVDSDTLLNDVIATVLPEGGPFAPWDEERAYEAPRARLYFRQNCRSELAQQSEGEEHWVEVPGDASVAELVRDARYETPGFPVLWILAEGSAFHADFEARHKGKIRGFREKFMMEETGDGTRRYKYERSL